MSTGNAAAEPLMSSTGPISANLSALLRSLRPGQRIRITQTVRVGAKKWTTTVDGAFRSINHLVTGLATDRVPQDDIVVVVVRFTKDNGEMSSIALDDASTVELLK
jgi:hypothetical protein